MIRRFIAAALAAILTFVPVAAVSQVATWNYAAPGNVSTATYPGNVTILGTCTGCTGGGGAITGTTGTFSSLAGSGTRCVQTDNTGLLGLYGAGCTSLAVANTWASTQTFNGSATTIGTVINGIAEPVTVTAAAPAATTNYDALTQSVQLYTTNAANNWTLNIRGSGSTALNSVLAVGQAMTVVLIATEGATPFYANAIQVDSVGVTPKWQGGAPSAGNANGLDVYTFTVIKTASATYTVLASLVQFK